MRQNKNLKRKVRNSYFVSTVSISLVLFLLGSVGYMMATALEVSKSLRESIIASVELGDGVGEKQRGEIRKQIAAFDVVGEVSFSSKEDKIEDEEFRKMFGLEFEDILDDNPLMDSFDVALTLKGDGVEALDRFAEEVGKIDGVTRVGYPAMLVQQVNTTVSKFQLVMMLFGGTLLFISLVLLNNTIRLAIFSRRGIINTMKLVGATKWFIVRPFLWSGICSGFWAGVLASMLLAATLYGLQESLAGMLSREQLYNAAVVMGAMVGGGMVISTLFTWVSVSRFVNMKSNKIELY